MKTNYAYDAVMLESLRYSFLCFSLTNSMRRPRMKQILNEQLYNKMVELYGSPRMEVVETRDGTVTLTR